MSVPVPGTCIRVLLRPAKTGPGVWADVIQREKADVIQRDTFLCQTVDDPILLFSFCPEDVRNGRDEKVVKWSDAKEPEEKMNFMMSEIKRMQDALFDGKLWLLNTEVMKVPGFSTDQSQLRLKAIILDENAGPSAREMVKEEVERFMERGAANEDWVVCVRGVLRGWPSRVLSISCATLKKPNEMKAKICFINFYAARQALNGTVDVLHILFNHLPTLVGLTYRGVGLKFRT